MLLLPILICPDQGPSRAPRAACVSTWLGEYFDIMKIIIIPRNGV